MLNFAIIEDDENILKNLNYYLESIFMQHDFDAEIGIHTTNVDTLLSYINKNKVDVLILDIDLNSTLSGLEIAKKVGVDFVVNTKNNNTVSHKVFLFSSLASKDNSGIVK